MEPSKEAIAVRITRLNRQILGKVTSGTSKLRKTIDRETLLDALTVLYDECNDDPVKKCDELVRTFVDKFRSTLADLRRTRVCLSDFDIVQTIGRGHFGEVQMVREKQTSDVYALKIIRKEIAAKRAAGAAEDERDVLATATGPWFPRLQYAFQDSNSLYLVMELCIGGDLCGLLARRNHPLAERDAAFYIAEVAHALKALHGMGFVHRDVKPHNILIDRCGHVKLGDFGSCVRLSEGGAATPVGTADYVAPELLAAADCAARHHVCLQSCRGIVQTAISACDYWSLGVVAFELVTLRRPFSSEDDDSISKILANIQKYERSEELEPLLGGAAPSAAWCSLTSGLLRVSPARRYSYLDTLQHAALAHLASHSIRDQAPPWVPCVRGAEDASYFSPSPRTPHPPSAAPFRARPPFAGQLPFVGYSYVAPEENEDHSGGFNASHDCTAIDLATYKSAEKLAAMRGREISSLQQALAAAEAAAGAEAERARRAADDEAERTRARLQADITALSLQNKRLERQLEVEKEERMALERTNQQLATGISERTNAELRAAMAAAADVQAERDALKNDLRRLESRVAELQAECARAVAVADTAQQQQRHYKNILEHAKDLRHRRLSEINVRAIDTIAKERALRRQTLSGGEAESREAGARVAQAEATAAKETRARELAEKRLTAAEEEASRLQTELDEARRELAKTQESLGERRRCADASTDQLREAQIQLAQERARVAALVAQVQELERGLEEAGRREAALEEQCVRTEARFCERLEGAEARATAALQDDVRHREKVTTLEKLVRQLEREVSALEGRACSGCSAREGGEGGAGDAADGGKAHSDTESVGDGHCAAQATVLREQLERAEAQLQARAEEIAALRQEARTANLARWRKEREFNELSVETKTMARDLKRAEERLATAIEARKAAEQKALALQNEMTTLKPQYERANKDLERLKEQFQSLQKAHETAQAEVDRSRNDIRKLKSELQYSEKRRLHAEEQEELSSRERAQLRDELAETRRHNHDLVQNNKALQEACSVMEEQLTDLEKITDINEIKNNELQTDSQRVRAELEQCRARLADMERVLAERTAAASSAAHQHEEARDQVHQAYCSLQLLKERLEAREARAVELELRAAGLEAARDAAEGALAGAARRLRELHEECAALRTRAHHYHTSALQLQAALADAQEEIAAVREASEAATAWWRTRETKADATLRQQAKLIDFLQAKVEEAGRKKCSLSNKLFGRSGRRTTVSPPLRRANRELREEIDRLRAKLSATTHSNDSYLTTPKREINKIRENGTNGIDVPDNSQESDLYVLWPDGTRERMRARCVDGAIVLGQGEREFRGHLLSADAKNLPQNEADRAFTVSLERGETAIVCSNVVERAQWVSRLAPAPAALYSPPALLPRAAAAAPRAALYVAPNAIAIGCDDGLRSLRGEVALELDCEMSPQRLAEPAPVSALVAVAGRALLVCGELLLHSGLLALGSAVRRASTLRPSVGVSKVRLPEIVAPHLIKPITGNHRGDGPSVAVACRRRVFLLRFDAALTEFKMVRSITVDRPANSILLTNNAVYIAGEKPLKVNLPSGVLGTFGMEEPIIAAAAKKHSPPMAILLIQSKPLEILLCYAECGVFVDEHGKKTRNEDPKWSSAIHGWEFVNPFLYLIGDEKVTIVCITEEAYRALPCTCDTQSVTSTASECYMPEIFKMKVKEPVLLGTAPNGIIVSVRSDEGYNILIIDGMAAFRSIGASVESLETISDTKGSSSDLAQSMTDLAQSTTDLTHPTNEMPQDISRESVETTTGFLADIRKRARQLRKKRRKDKTPEDIIKEILTAEVGLKQSLSGKKSPAMISDCDSELDSECVEQSGTETTITKGTADLCGEMFTRQVRFQQTN